MGAELRRGAIAADRNQIPGLPIRAFDSMHQDTTEGNDSRIVKDGWAARRARVRAVSAYWVSPGGQGPRIRFAAIGLVRFRGGEAIDPALGNGLRGAG